jgi:hypothetical protein
LKFSAACAVAAAVAYPFAVHEAPPVTHSVGAPTAGPEIAAASESRIPEPNAAAVRSAIASPVVHESTDAATEEVRPAGANPGGPDAVETVTAQGETAGPSTNPRGHAAQRNRDAALTAPEIAALITRGRAYFEAGDVAAARLVFRRAANAGDAAAAVAMGATYDPAVLASRFVRGMGADVEEARTWYERARELGSPEGPRRIEMLAHR